jgi:hypothetical protein
MKTTLIALIAGLTSIAAQADGFICQSEDGLAIKVFNHTQASEGTRNAAVMIISDQNISYGNKTVAKFDADNTVLSNKGAAYTAKVDLRYTDSKRKGELIAGTKLGYIETLKLGVAFSYGYPVKAGEEMSGSLLVVKRDGSKSRVAMTCERYLKN